MKPMTDREKPKLPSEEALEGFRSAVIDTYYGILDGMTRLEWTMRHEVCRDIHNAQVEFFRQSIRPIYHPGWTDD